jgi:hypothetical protein
VLIRGVLIALSGFLFIFAPGVPMGLLRRYSRGLPREHLYWGMGIWLVVLIPAFFLQSLVRQFVQGAGTPTGGFQGQPSDYGLTLVNALITALLLAGGMAIYLHRKKLSSDETDEAGLTLGFGVGLIAQVFTGLSLVGAGFRMAYGDTGAGLADMAGAPMFDLILSLLALVLYRVALLTVCGAVGLLLARAVAGPLRLFWLAAGIHAAFHWLIIAAQLAIGFEDPGAILLGRVSLLASGVAVVYYLAATALAYLWLRRSLTAAAGRPAVAPAGGRRR